MTTTPDDLVTAFTNLTESRLDEIARRMAADGLPADAYDAITADAAVALAGAALAVRAFIPRPPLADDGDADALYTLLADIADSQVATVLATWTGKLALARGAAAAQLRLWNSERQEAQQPSEFAIAKQMATRRLDGTVTEPVDSAHFTVTQNADGSFTPHYTIRPTPEKG